MLRGKHAPTIPQHELDLPDVQHVHEPANLELHRRQVEREELTFFNGVDNLVAQEIGFKGNIREELFRRRPLDSHKDINTDGMNPVLVPHLVPGGFSYREKDPVNLSQSDYRIDYHGGSFKPEVRIIRPDNQIQVTVFTGPSRNEYDHVQIEKTYTDGHVRTITTFDSHYLTPSRHPDHPLVVDENGLRMIYDYVDLEGNVTLLDGQPFSWGRYLGNYSAKSQTIIPQEDFSFPPCRVENDILTFAGSTGHDVRIPLKTNLYNEIRAMTNNQPSLSQE